MKIITHKNFKRLNKENEKETANMIEQFEKNVLRLLRHRRHELILPHEKEKLRFFDRNTMLIFKNFDRLYHIYYKPGKTFLGEPLYACAGFYLLGRMNIDGKYIFVEMRGFYHIQDDEIPAGYFFMSVDATVFLKTLMGEPLFNTLRQCLVDDGIKLNDDDIHEEYIEYFEKIKANVSPFRNIRHLDFNDLRDTLKLYKDYLPEYLRDKIDDFIEFYIIKGEYKFFQRQAPLDNLSDSEEDDDVYF